ncbi:MAG: xanthine dehydrogenase family protein molybdopterin-binding subunit [Aggregatilineales bacterium]
MPDFKAIGRPTPLIDGRTKVTGAIRFAPDLNLPGMLYARFVPSLYAHANLRSIDTSQALAVPGVVAVLTARDLPNIPPSDRSHLLLARGRVIFVGQPVALVLATSEVIAEDGAERVVVDYEPLPAAVTMDEALAENAPLVWPNGVPSGSNEAAAEHGISVEGGDQKESKASNIAGSSHFTRGDVTVGFAEADVIVERTYSTPMVHQSPIETQTVLAQPDPDTGGMTIWASSQTQFGLQHDIAALLEIPDSDVRVTATPVGGAFGSKFGLYEALAAIAARAVGRPVRLALSRTEEMIAANPAPPARLRLRIGAKPDGTLTAIEGDVTLDNGCFPFGLAGFLAYMLGSFYRVPNFDLNATDVMTFKQSAGAYRAPGATSLIFALDSAIDELAERLNLDPIDMRLRNIAVVGDPMADGSPWPANGAREVLEAVRNHPVWQNRAASKAAGRGVGVSVGGWMGGTEPAAAVCSLQRDGLLHVNVGSVDLSGTTTSFALVAAEAFGVSPDKVRIITSDTETAPYAGGTGGSKTMYTVGGAVAVAAAEARRQTLAIAAEEFEAAVEDLEIIEGKVMVRGVPSSSLKLSDLAGKTMQFGGKYAPVFAGGRTAERASSPAFCAQLAEVEVDRETGAIQVDHLVVAQDVGRAINPLTIQGQMMGGATQGLGWALYEKMVYDEQGQLLTGSWLDYNLPHSSQGAEKIETILVEVPSDKGPFGARGVGEPPVIPTAAAVANAIAAATGVRLTDLPMTAPKVLAALNEQHQGANVAVSQ